jgi:hypothetical protein
MTAAKKSQISGTIILIITIFSLSFPAYAKYGGGTGEPNDPYLIYTAEQLNTIGLNQEDADKHFKLMADIDLSAYKGDSFNRIGFYDPPEFAPDWHPPFEGVFDGNNHTISNFTYVVDVNEPLEENGIWGDEYVGFFGRVSGQQAQIKNLGLIDPNIYPAATCTERVRTVGAIAGRLSEGSITNCSVEGGRISADFTVGGLVGSNLEGTISNCHTTCNVTRAKDRWLRPLEVTFNSTGYSFGGLVGSSRGWIYNCHATGSVQAAGTAGGLVGFSDSDWWNPDSEIGVISDSYATGDVTGDKNIGGLAGENSGRIDRCFAVGNVSGSDYTGGLVGNMIMEEGSISYSYSIANVSGNEQVGGLVGYSNGSIRQSYAISEVLGTVYVGGLVGWNGFGTIHNSYSWGCVTGSENVGALTGRNGGGSIYYCYAVNAVSGSENVGGLLGGNVSGTVSSCFWNIETSGLPDMCGFQGSSANGCDNTYGKTTIEMQTAGTFMDAGWDFVDETTNGTEDIWKITEGLSYPQLWWEKYGGGTGEPNDPYLIYTAEHMNAIGAESYDWDKHFKLMADIDMSGFPFDKAVIAPDLDEATEDFEGIPFSGEFDGNNHRILNLIIDTQGNDRNYLGLFGSIAADGIVVNLGMETVKIVGCGNRVYYPIVEFTGSFGGLCGINSGRIYSCWVNGSVTGGNYSEDIGGLCGCNKTRGSITYCYATGCAEGGAGSGGIGGLCGSNEGNINNCWTNSSVIGRNSLGGLCGYLDGGNIENSYSTGLVKGTAEYLGGLCGEVNWGTISNCFWDMETSGLLTSNGGIGKTTTEMQTASTFLDAGWDFVDEMYNGADDIWWILEGQDYPRLWWEAAEQ